MSNYAMVFEGNFEEIWGEAEKKFGKLTDNDKKVIDGSYDKFIGKLKKHYGYNEDEVLAIAQSFIDGLGLNSLMNKIHHIKENLYDNANDIKLKIDETVSNAIKNVKDKSSDVQENLVTYIKKNPTKSILFAVLAGALAGKLFSK